MTGVQTCALPICEHPACSGASSRLPIPTQIAEVTLKAPGIRSVTTVTPDSSVVTLTEESSEAEVEDMSLLSYCDLASRPARQTRYSDRSISIQSKSTEESADSAA